MSLGWGDGATMGSFTIGLGVVVHHFVSWWPGRKRLQKDPMGAFTSFLPFAFGFAYGMLIILGVGGLVGWLADAVVWGVGWVGDGALVWGVGGQRESLSVGGKTLALTNGGLMIVLLLMFLAVALRKKAAALKQDIGRGTLGGVLTGTVPSVSAAFAIPLASFVNAAGSWLPGSGS